MSYRIFYGRERTGKERSEGCGEDISGMIILLILLTTISAYRFWPSGRAAIQTIFFPDASETAVQTMNQLAGEIRQGAGFEKITHWIGEELKNASIWR